MELAGQRVVCVCVRESKQEQGLATLPAPGAGTYSHPEPQAVNTDIDCGAVRIDSLETV